MLNTSFTLLLSGLQLTSSPIILLVILWIQLDVLSKKKHSQNPKRCPKTDLLSNSSPKPKDFPFAIINDKEKRQSFALKKLEMANS